VPEYRPPQRTIPARVLTPAGWISGTFHLAKLHSFTDFLSANTPFYTLTSAVLPAAKAPVRFIGLRRSAARVILPLCDEANLLLVPPQNETDEHRVHCLLEAGSLIGTLAVKKRLRLSDFLSHQTGFVMLRDCALGEARTAAPLAFVNAQSLVGMGEIAG
jgi:hypothetical protein